MADRAAHPGVWRSLTAPLLRALRWVGRVFLLFLEVIGLRSAPSKTDRELELARLRLVHTEFRKLLSGNEHFLEAMAELEHKLYQGGAIELASLRRRIVQATVDVFRMISSLNRIADGRYARLDSVFEKIAGSIEAVFAATAAGQTPDGAAVLSMSELGLAAVSEAGGKLATLGELGAAHGLPVPDGFVVTASAYRRLLREGAAERIRSELMTVFSGEDIPRVSAAVQAELRGAELPEWLSREILLAYDRLAERLGSPPLVAVRSSALEEDSDRSFAGQFCTRLGVDRDGLLPAYREVVASLYSSEAMHYRRLAHLSGEEAAMAVGVVAMVDALSSGVVYSRDPRAPESGDILIQAVHGLGLLLADGRTSPEALLVARGEKQGSPAAGVRRTASRQIIRAVLAAGGPREEELSPDEAARSCLSDEDAGRLAAWALQLEERLHGPQDIEWALDQERRLRILQARPLGLASAGSGLVSPPPDAEVLLSGGETACPGVGAGPVVRLDEDSDLERFPSGAVLVAPRSSPRFVRVMDRCRAIVTDAGSATGHMASVARELSVPALLGTRTATQDLRPGTPVTVDAGACRVYAGLLQVEAGRRAERVETARTRRAMASAPARRLLEQAAALIVPLQLTDPRSPEFTPEGCRTLHDLARFVHEKSYEEMFGLGTRLGETRPFSHKLDVFLPLDLYIIDLGGGLQAPPGAHTVKPGQVTSVPLAALLRGMTHEGIPRFGPRPLDARGLFSVMMRHAVTNPEAEPTFRDPCYAMISDHYLNYTSRVGYHFGVVDAFCGPEANRNYINLHFRGGAADLLRRGRRARAIAEILRASGLHAEVDRDAVDARLSRATLEDTAARLEMIGRLLQFMRQMDVSMVSDEAMAHIRDAFLQGDYGLNGKREGD